MLGDNNNANIDNNGALKKTNISLNLIETNPDQPRKNFDQDKLTELSKSIKNLGQLVPIIIRENRNNNKFIVVAGERRWRAAKMAGLKSIDAIIYKKNEQLSSLASIIENVQREDLNSLEEANAYNSLISEYNLTHDEISKFTGKSRSYISNSVRILGLPENIKKLLSSKKISFGHARALLSAKNVHDLAKIIINNQLNVRQTEDLVKNEQQNKKLDKNQAKSLVEKDPNISDYEKYLSLKLGYEVQIRDRKGKGTISVKYKNLDQLEQIISIFNKKN
ncbi:MAG: putative chromosome-partitioning protein ParB [Alphaproteobacteria bacterium MarineAlpha9_Bin4]|nr:MAG: putative chromosome-partitioning protein ParB [Alphaproteobacteria bacterium MarineAlpha9_Bin4]